MRARTINETVSFERYRDPKKALFPDDPEMTSWQHDKLMSIANKNKSLSQRLQLIGNDLGYITYEPNFLKVKKELIDEINNKDVYYERAGIEIPVKIIDFVKIKKPGDVRNEYAKVIMKNTKTNEIITYTLPQHFVAGFGKNLKIKIQ